ncbi:MAG TPA: nuclear transport factor 2 family protein [Gemmatimonadaceae bacterium]
MTTRETIERYFELLKARGNWPSLFSETATFTSFASPPRQLAGRDTLVNATSGFYGMIRSVEVRDLLVDGARACALTHYRLEPPNGRPAFESDVAEIFTVRGGAIESFGIYFDSAPYPK